MDNDYRQKETDRRLLWLEEHYSVFNSEFGYVKNNVEWLVKYHWITATAAITAAVGAVVAVLITIIKTQ